MRYPWGKRGLALLPVERREYHTSYWMGFQQYHALKIMRAPRILGQAAGRRRWLPVRLSEIPETVATAIRIEDLRRGGSA